MNEREISRSGLGNSWMAEQKSLGQRKMVKKGERKSYLEQSKRKLWRAVLGQHSEKAHDAYKCTTS